MPEELSNTEAEEGSQPKAGERLAMARRDQEIALRDIAKELHLDEPKVQALEQNRFESLGAPVFARGHLRKYAEIVGIDPDEVSAEYDELTTGLGEPPIVGNPRAVRREIDLTGYLIPGAITLIILIVAIIWFRAGTPLPSFDDSDSESGSAIELTLPAGPAADDGQTENSGATEASPAPEETATEVATAEPESAPDSGSADAAPEPLAAPSGPQVSMELVFTGNCWTEVTDADGQRLFFDLGSEGRSVEVSGTAPLRVLFGSYANVVVFVEGEDFPVPASARRGETARFTVNLP